MTIKLYDQDSHIRQFIGRVLACEPSGTHYEILLDQTAFFPGGGGQAPDSGRLGETAIRALREEDGNIYHMLDLPFPVGSELEGEIDWALRFARMQNHSGEHIISGRVNAWFGYHNVGFHMNEQEMTLDFDGALCAEEIGRIETEANRIVTSNIAVTVSYPEGEALKGLAYRSKLELTEHVRIVSVGAYDICACCAPHVRYTGEIGAIKILEFMRHRGGTRMRVVCGRHAVADYQKKHEGIAEICALLSVQPEHCVDGVKRILGELQAQKNRNAELTALVLAEKIKQIPQTEGNLCLFEPNFDTNQLRELVNGGMRRCSGICAVFTGSEGVGYRYVIGSRSVNLRDFSRDMNRTLHGKGGGLPEMIQGSVGATRAEIEAYFRAR